MKKAAAEISHDVSFWPVTREMPKRELADLIQREPAFGRIICRCEGVSEGEILAAIRQNPRPRDLDGVKRRTRAQMGRCQGGRCTQRIEALLGQTAGQPLRGTL